MGEDRSMGERQEWGRTDWEKEKRSMREREEEEDEK